MSFVNKQLENWGKHQNGFTDLEGKGGTNCSGTGEPVLLAVKQLRKEVQDPGLQQV